MANKEGLGSECVRLNIDIRTGDLIDEGGFSDIRIPADEKCPGVGVDSRKTGDVLTHLLEVSKGVFLSAHYGSHA